MVSYSPDEDGFIWTDFFRSPDGKTLATIGCVWAYPYEIRIYDFNDPMKLPLKELKSLVLIGNETISCWLDNMSIQTRGTDEEYTEQELDDGTIDFQVTGVKVIDRVISINS